MQNGHERNKVHEMLSWKNEGAPPIILKVHKREKFFVSDFEFFAIL